MSPQNMTQGRKIIHLDNNAFNYRNLEYSNEKVQFT